MESAPAGFPLPPLIPPGPPFSPRAAQRQWGGVSPEGQVARMPVDVRGNF
jgi:hypothetical protein